MKNEDLLAAVAILLDDLAARPEDRALLEAQLRGVIREMRARDLPVHAELAPFEADPDAAGGEGADFFDNLPV